MDPGGTISVQEIARGRKDPALEFVPNPVVHMFLVSMAGTCCVNASKAGDRIMRMAPKAARHL